MNEIEPTENHPYFDADPTELIDGIEVGEDDLAFKEATKTLVMTALREIEQKYGKDGQGAKPFHDSSHTKEFIIDALKGFDAIAASRPDLNLTAHHKLMLVRAGAWHDVDQDQDPEKNEKESAHLLNKNQEQGVSETDKALMRRLIEATTFNFSNHQQKLSKFGDATTAGEALEQCMALADLAALGDYDRQHWRANRLAHEIKKADDPKAWFGIQIGFLKKQKQYLENSFGSFPVEVLYGELDRNIELYEGLNENYEKLLAQDLTNEEIMAKDKPTTDRVKQTLEGIKAGGA